PALIEKALAKSIPVLIGVLASILGVGGIAEKVKNFFSSLAKPVMKVVDWVVGKVVGFGKKIWGKMKAGAKKLKDKVTGKGGGKDKEKGAEPGRPGDVRAQVSSELASRLPATGASASQVRTILQSIYGTYAAKGLKRLELKRAGD